MSVLEKLKSKTAPIAPPVAPVFQPPPRAAEFFGLKTEDIGSGLRQWSGYVDETLAAQILEGNSNNRPLSDAHAKRIARQMSNGLWKINGETVKIGSTGDVLDGQHRLWAVIYAKVRVWLIIVFGVQPDAFSTIDTIRKSRSGSDVLAVAGLTHHRGQTSAALLYLIHYQRGTLLNSRAAENRVENAQIEEAYTAHPEMVRAVAHVSDKLRRVMNASVLGFAYYLLASHDEVLAERMLDTLQDPSAVSINDPFFKLREHLLIRRGDEKRVDALMMIALIIKAVNAAHEGKTIEKLGWRSHGERPEAFPQFWWT
jgi:hypothetical protein